LPGVAYPGVRDNRSTIDTKTGYDDDDDDTVKKDATGLLGLGFKSNRCSIVTTGLRCTI